MPDKLILASNSPRRIEILKECRISFKIVKHSFNEDSIKINNPVKLAELIAYNKAKSVADQKDYFNEFVLGVDTIVVLKNHILGKPQNKNEAEKFIRLLSDKSHKVISGISIINNKKNIKLIDSSVSYVNIIKINEDFINYYLDNNLYEGYAGGYAIQGIFNMFVKKIKGSYSNIVGLPVEILYKMLIKINYKFGW